METFWNLQHAKAQFSKVVNDALEKGPQFVTRRGVKTVVILSVEEYEKLASKKMEFKDYLLNCPKIDGDVDFERKRDHPRSIDL